MNPGKPEAEHAVDARLARELLEEQHPDLAALPLEMLAEGWDNVMFRLGDALVVRLPRREIAEALIVNEQKWLPLLAAQLPIAIPAPVRVGVPAHGYPWHWSVVPWIEGEPADRAPVHEDQAERLAEFLRVLHIEAPANAPENPVRGVPLASRAQGIEERLVRLRPHTSLITKTIEAVWQAGLDAPDATESRWLHGDLHMQNVLVRNGAITGIIDWGDITSGDVATDLASVWMLLDEADARAQALSHYAPDKDALARARAWAVLFGVVLLDSGLTNNPPHIPMGEAILRRISEDAETS